METEEMNNKKAAKKKRSTAENSEPMVDEERSEAEQEDGETSAEQKADTNQESREEEANGQPEEEEKKEETQEEMEVRFKSELAEKDDKYMRLLAEFENFKRRTNQEMQSRFKFASQPLALSIVSGLDGLERAIAQAKEEENEQLKEFVVGIEMVQQQLYDALRKNNIERSFPKGELFDPNQHEAMGVVETDDIEPDHVAEVFQAGYILHDRVIRPAMVQVAKKK
ncbi:MAG: nucleotide exchange factor GrpE [Proteobacteria bacterium]|nr:nucleotide exchange factor GrpE [Pseudomonadota bacterium]